jgi:hypothetical protein
MESLQVRAFRYLAVLVFIPLPYVSKLPLAIDPLAYVLRTIHDLCARELTGSQRANEIHIHERQFLQIQYNFWSVPFNLSRQFLNMLRLKMTNQANRRPSAARFRLDPQWPSRSFKTSAQRIAMLVPKEAFEYKRVRSRQKPETSGLLKVRKNRIEKLISGEVRARNKDGTWAKAPLYFGMRTGRFG